MNFTTNASIGYKNFDDCFADYEEAEMRGGVNGTKLADVFKVDASKLKSGHF